MSDLRNMMDEVRRRNPAPDGGFDRLARRRARRLRNERLLAGAVALAVAIVAVWGLSRAFLHSPSVRPADRLSPQSTRTLRHAWTSVLPSIAFNIPVAAEGRLFESDVNQVHALDPATGRLLFSGDVGRQATRPAVSGGTVYVASGSSLVAFSVACAGQCPATWQATLTGGPVAALVGAPGVQTLVTVGTDGSLRAYATDCGEAGGDCAPLWTASEGTFTATAPPEVDATGVSAITTDGAILRFPLDCAGSTSCPPTWRGRGPSGSPTGVTVSTGLVVAATSGGVMAFAADCAHGGGSCDPLWQATVPSGVTSPPAAGAGIVVVGSGNGAVYGFRLRCLAAPGGCRPSWRSTDSLHLTGAPVIAGSVAFLTTVDGRLVGFSSRCAEECHPLWSSTMQQGRVPAGGPVVSGTTVVGVVGDHVFGFTPGGR